MQEIKAIVRPERLDAVLRALHELPELPGVTLSDVRGIGRRAEALTGERLYGATRMAKLQIVVPDSLVERVLQAIEA